jgi:hypothetical protein
VSRGRAHGRTCLPKTRRTTTAAAMRRTAHRACEVACGTATGLRASVAMALCEALTDKSESHAGSIEYPSLLGHRRKSRSDSVAERYMYCSSLRHHQRSSNCGYAENRRANLNLRCLSVGISSQLVDENNGVNAVSDSSWINFESTLRFRTDL